MLGVNCLIKNTRLHTLAKEAVITLGDMYVATGVIPTVKDIWRELRANGFEVDVSTVAHLYITELSPQNSEYLQQAEVEKQSSGALTRAINAIINTDSRHQLTGEESPVEKVAHGLGAMYKALNKNSVTKSLQKDLQDILLRGVRRMLPANSALKNSKNFEEVIQAALENAGKGFMDVAGDLNSLKTMHTALKKELKAFTATLAVKDGYEAAMFEDYVAEIMSSSYQLLLTKTEANKVVTGALRDFDEGRYVRVSETTDTVTGVVTRKEKIDWKGMSREVKTANDVANLIQQVFESKLDSSGNRLYSDEDIDIIKTSVAKEYVNVFKKNIVAKAIKNKTKTVQIRNKWQKTMDLVYRMEENERGKPTPEQKEEFKKIAELQAMGAFSDGKFNPLIYKALGVKDLTLKSMEQIEAISQTINKLLENVKSPLQANLLFRQLTSEINLILHNNITKSDNVLANAALRTIHHFNLYTQAALNGILMNIFNMAQNVTANTMQMLSTSVNLITNVDKRYLNKNVKLFWNTLMDVSFKNGLVDGLQAGEFANEARLDDYLKRSFKELFTNKSVGDKFLGILKAVLMPFRILGSAYDVAAKAVNTKKLFTIGLNDVLVAKGLDKDARFKIISDSLYDGKLIDESVAEAERLIELIGEPPNKHRAYRMAQQIMAYKIVESGTIDEAQFNAIAKTAFMVSGKGLGHEYQYVKTDGSNIGVQAISLPGRMADVINATTQGWKNANMGNNNKIGYAVASLADNIKTAIFTKFIGGATRWVPLTLQSGGLGVLAISQLGKKIDLYAANGDIKSEGLLRGDLETKLTKNEAFFRGLTGMAYSYTIGLIIRELLNTECDPKDPECAKEKASAMAYVKDKMSSKIDPHGNMMKLAMDAFDGDGKIFDKDSKKFIFQLFNIDNKFSPEEQLKSIAQNTGMVAMDNDKQKPDKQQAYGSLGRLIGAPYTNPINAYFKAYDVLTKGKPPFVQPTSFIYGGLSEGMIERVGLLKKGGITNDGVTGYSGVSGSTVEELRINYGITTKTQLNEYVQKNGFEKLTKKIVSPKAKKGYYIRKIFDSKQEATIREQMQNK